MWKIVVLLYLFLFCPKTKASSLWWKRFEFERSD